MTHITTERIEEMLGEVQKIRRELLLAKNLDESIKAKDVAEMQRELLQRREADRWTPTSEALPKAGQLVFTYKPSGRWFEATRFTTETKENITGGQWWDSGRLITRWRALPEFKEEK